MNLIKLKKIEIITGKDVKHYLEILKSGEINWKGLFKPCLITRLLAKLRIRLMNKEDT
jgi:hypothetical protein